MLENGIFEVKDRSSFERRALNTFNYQYHQVPVYQEYCNFLGKNPDSVKVIDDIPYLPIQFFKTHQVLSSEKKPSVIFTSSGTTGSSVSKHFVAEESLYRKSYLQGFEHFYGAIENWTILALLPSYLERSGSSLVVMVDDLIQRTNKPSSGFYLHNLEASPISLSILITKEKKFY